MRRTLTEREKKDPSERFKEHLQTLVIGGARNVQRRGDSGKRDIAKGLAR